MVATRVFVSYLLAFVFAIFLVGCASQRYSSESISVGSATTGLYGEDNTGRKLIYNASVTLVSNKPDSAVSKVVELARKYGGYMVGIRDYYVTIRVQSVHLKSALNELEKIGKVKDKYIYTQDITDEFKDLSIRLDNAEKARNRYLELLSKAQSVEEALKVEKELERLNTEIDLLKGKIQNYQHLEKYSTLSVSVKQKTILGPLGYVSKGIYHVIKFLFVIKG